MAKANSTGSTSKSPNAAQAAPTKSDARPAAPSAESIDIAAHLISRAQIALGAIYAMVDDAIVENEIKDKLSIPLQLIVKRQRKKLYRALIALDRRHYTFWEPRSRKRCEERTAEATS